MLRVSAKQINARYPTATKIINQSVRHYQGAPPPTGIGKKLIGLTLVTGASAAGVIGYAYKDPEFRQTIENYIPQTKELFKSIIGPAEVTYPVQIPPKILKPSFDEQSQSQIEEAKRIEQRRIEEEKRIEQRRIEEEKRIEADRHSEFSDADIEERLRDYRQNLDVQYEKRIRQTEALHADNLERVVKTLKQIHNAESEQAIEEAVEKERRLHSKQVSVALEKLHGMEVALESRAEMDNDNRRAKHIWIACQNLLESIVYGQKPGSDYEQRRKPLEGEIDVIATACESDQFVSTIASYFSQVALKYGVYTEQDIKNRFKKVYKIASRTASIDDNGGTLAGYILSWIQSLFIVEIPRVYSPDDTVSLAKLDNREIIARVRHFVDKGDFISAVRLAQYLKGEPANVARSWINDTRTHLEARFLAELLLSHSGVVSVRSIY